MTPQANPSRLGLRSLTVPLTALLVFASTGFAQLAKPADQTPPPAPPATVAKATPSEEVVVMSPFEVSTDKNAGYYTANTLAGTRLRNNIGDLPSSVTIVTRQQLEDTNSVNINDVFRYEANTEGASTYTPIAIVRSNLADTLAGNGGTTGNYTGAVATGNRVRGLSTVDNEEDNFFSLYRIPFDSYNTQSIEVLRGPNSIIFGTGSPAGIVNQQRIEADTEKRSGNLNLSLSSYGGLRESFGANVPIISKRLGIYVGQLYNSVGFKQKPSSDITRRQYVAMTFYPFKSQKTKLTASFENYNNYANDPNGVTPVDLVTPWIQSGRPVWNTNTDVVTYLNTGRMVGPYAASNAYPNYNVAPSSLPITQALMTTTTSPYFVPSLTLLSNNHRTMFVTQGNVEYTFNGSESAGFSLTGWVPALTAMTTADKLINEARLTLTTGLPAPVNAAGAYIYATWANAGVTSKSVYDWSNVNVNSLSNTSTRAKTYTVKLEQQILKNLYVQLAWFRQDLNQLQDAPLSQANATTMYVDTNQYLLNGQPNAHVGQPFLDVYQVDVYNQPESNNNLQAMITYEPDFRGKVPGWLEWLGHHRFMVVLQQHDDVSTALRYRPGIVGGDPNYLPTAATLAASTGYTYTSNSAIEEWIYMGTPAAANLQGFGASSPGYLHRAGYGGPTSANIQTYNYTTHSWNTTEIDMAPVLFQSGGLSENLQRSATFFWQGYFWNDRLIGLFGVNQDKVKNRNTLFPSVNPTAILYTNGFANEQYWRVYGPWTPVVGTTHTAGLVAHPFTNWKGLDAAAERGSIIPAFLRTLSVTVNRAGNFNPPTTHYTDFFGNDLGKPQGREKDWGLEIATPDNKFFLRATWFHTTNENALTTTLTSNARAQYIDQTELKAWATKVVQIRTFNATGYGAAPGTVNFGSVTLYPITQAMQDQIAALTQLPYNYGNNVGQNGQYVNATTNQNGDARGFELELTYNPTHNWTMKFSVAQQKTTVTGTAAQARAWVNYRYPTWHTYMAADLTGIPGDTTGPAGTYPIYNSTNRMDLRNFWQAYGYDSNVTQGNINGWTTTANYYNIVVGGQLAIDEANNGALAPNQREWAWRYLTNYVFNHGRLRCFGIGGAVRWDGKATVGYFGDTVHLNSTNQVAAPDITHPIYTPAKYHLDAWVSYSFKMPWVEGVNCKLQLNVADLTSGGYLLPVTYNFDGSPAGMRIIQPRTYTLSANFAF